MKWRSWGKWPLLGLAGAVATVVMAYVSKGTEGEALVAAKANVPPKGPPNQAATREPPPDAGHVELERFNRQKAKNETSEVIANAFNSTTWRVAPPPPPPAPPAPPPEPVAPPLPFSYLGRYEDKSKLVVILAKGDRVYTVSEGEVIEGTYRVEQIADDAVNLVYLPMKITQSLSTAGVLDNKQLRAGMRDRYGRP